MAGRPKLDPSDPGLKAWSATISYVGGDVVTYASALYGAIKSNTNVTPGTDSKTWDLLIGDTEDLGAGFAPTLAPATCNATLGVNGTAVAAALASGKTTIQRVDAITLTYAGVAGETVTATVTATYDDASTVAITDTKAASGANTVSAANLLTLVKDGRRMTGLNVAAKSSINNSVATVTMAPKGWQSL